jgi:TolA-binding protein
MIDRTDPPHDSPHDPRLDVDALARRLPRREPRAERSAAMRRALLDAAQQRRAPLAPRAHRWAIGLGLAAAAAAGALLVLRTTDHPPVAGLASTAPAPAANRSPAAARPTPPPPAASAPAAGTQTASAALAATELPIEGVRTIAATAQPMQLTRGDATITVPPGARFEVDVRGDQVKRVTVFSGWVVVAGAHTPTTVVVERQTWKLDPPPAAIPAAAAGGAPRDASSSATAAPSSTRTPATEGSTKGSANTRDASSSSAGAPASTKSLAGGAAASGAPRAPSWIASGSPPSSRAAGAPGAEASGSGAAASDGAVASPRSTAAEVAAAPASAEAPAATAAERAFRDGLRALLAGDARGALEPLRLACEAPTTSQEDACYWAALARLRSGDRPGTRQAFQELLARWPASTHAGEASVALGWLLLDAGDRAAARSRFAAAVNDRMPSVRAEAARGLAAAK